MTNNSDSPRVLCRFAKSADRDVFIKNFQDDFELIICESDDEAIFKSQNSIFHALVLDQQAFDSSLPAQCKLAKPNCLVILFHNGIELNSLVSLVDDGKVDKCFAKPYDSNLIRSEIFTSFIGIKSQTKHLVDKQSTDLTPSVLIVDDEIIATKFLKKHLEKMACPCDILIADNAEQALDIFEQHKDSLAVIISDQRMPGMQGNQLLTEIKKHQPNIIRMLTSAYEEVDIALNAVNDGKIFRYIKKPWNAAEFNEMIKDALSEFQSRMNSLSNQQTDLTSQYSDILNKRKVGLFQCLLSEVDEFSGVGTLAYFFDCLDSVKTLPPKHASLRASQDTELESKLVSEFSRMILEKIQLFSEYKIDNQTQELKEFIADLTQFVDKHQTHHGFDINQASHNEFDLALIDCLKKLLAASSISLNSLEFSVVHGKPFMSTKEGEGIAMFKHLLSPQTLITSQMLAQQSELLALIMLCKKCNLDIQVFGKELEFGFSMQLPCKIVS